MTTPELASHTTFGSYLRFLRRRARLTQTELGIAVGYSTGQISMLENSQRSPNPTTIAALFVSALGIEDDETRREHLLVLATKTALGNTPDAAPESSRRIITEALVVTREELGQLEAPPWVPAYAVLRRDPLSQLHRWLEQERWVALCGLAGMGKSTLAAQLLLLHYQHSPVFWMTCTDATARVPETLLRQLALFAATHIADPQRIAAAVRQPLAGDPPIAYSQQLAMVGSVLAEISAPILVFDDAHLFNGSSPMGQLISRIRALAPGCRMLFVSREELQLPEVTQIHLGGLELAEVQLLHSRLAHKPGLDLEALQQQTGGSPMLMRLAISYWEQHGAFEAQALPFPVSHYLIETILKTLHTDARRLLDLLAIWQGQLDLTQPSLIEELSRSWDAYDHQTGLERLQRSRLIEHIASASPHPLLRAPLLLEINTRPSYRRQLHQIAAGLAFQMNEPLRAARHLAQADDLQAAYQTVLSQSVASLAPGEGGVLAGVVEELLELAVARQRSDPAQWNDSVRALLTIRGDVLVNTTRSDDAQASYYAALDLTAKPAERARLAEKIALCAYQRGAFEEALTLCEQALSGLGLSISHDAIQMRIQVESTRMRVLMTLARFDEARQLCEAALAMVRPVALVLPGLAGTIRAYANLALGYIARFQGDNAQARLYLNKCVQQARAIKATSVEADALQYLSTALRDMGDLEGAEQTGQEALNLAHAIGNEYLMSTILHHLSLSDYYHADLDRALWRTQQVLQLKIPMGDVGGVVASRMVRALVLVAQGQLQEALDCANQAARDCDLMENSWLRGIAYYGHAVVLSFTDDLAAAEQYALRALAIDLLKRDISFYTGAQIYLGLIYVAQGRLIEANSIIAPELPQGAGPSSELLRELVRGMWLLANGRQAEARDCANKLVVQAERCGFRIFALEGARLASLVDSPPPLAALPRMICCPGAQAIQIVHEHGSPLSAPHVLATRVV
jgi:ATP/maltotriose-dependent transcriptional regulator MalT